MKNILKVSLALALVAASATAAVAQTDGGSPIGAGAGVTGSVAPLGVPGGNTPGQSGNALSGAGAQGIANARAAFLNASNNGASVPNPAGGNVTVPQAAAQALGGVLGGSPTPAQITAVTNALTGVPAGASGPLVRALAAFGSSANIGTLTTAVNAFNAAVNALPAGAAVPPALLAIRSALAQASR
jgi:hypothetical protein